MNAPSAELAFVPGPRCRREPTSGGPLSGLAFAAKDLIDVAGDRKTSGNPDWQRTHAPPERSASVIELLLGSGARLEGKTITDELAFSLEGDNLHYGTPYNPRAPGRLPGGSSSGSASAVAQELVDFALGTDTGGSVRIPSSYCGIFGIRPSHGRVPVRGVTLLTSSFDTVGWMARDGRVLARVGATLLGTSDGDPPRRFLCAVDAFALANPECARELRERATELFGSLEEVTAFSEGPAAALSSFQTIRGWEAWKAHGSWIREARPRFAKKIEERFRGASAVTEEAAGEAKKVRERFVAHLSELVPPGTALLLPAAPSVALPTDSNEPGVSVSYRSPGLTLSSIASLGGVPEIALPIALVDGRPVGLGVIVARGRDGDLLALAASDRVARELR
ncbi:MAG: amidase [Thermoplasmata archaeon]